MSASGPSRHLEVERKFDVDASTQPPSFDGLEGVARVERAETQQLDAVYFDTVERDLASNRITLRRRTGGLDAGWHLKLPAGADARTEVRVPLGSDASDQVPSELLDLVLAIVRDRPVSPVARISTTRQVQLLHGADDAVIAEFCDDQVTAGRGADGSAAEQRWREWELELVGDSANAELMDRVCGRLLDAGAKPAGHGSKLARVLDTSPTDLPADPLHRALAELTGELLVWDRAVRAEADDAVHQMRVTARKIRSLLQASPDSFGLAKDAAVIDELRELGNVLGVARDAEVLADRYRSALDDLPPELIRGPIRETTGGRCRAALPHRAPTCVGGHAVTALLSSARRAGRAGRQISARRPRICARDRRHGRQEGPQGGESRVARSRHGRSRRGSPPNPQARQASSLHRRCHRC